MPDDSKSKAFGVELKFFRDQSSPDWLEKLSCCSAVYELFRQNVPLAQIARFIHSKGDLAEVSENTLRIRLVRVLKTIPPLELIENRLPASYMGIMESIDEQLDELQALTTLWHLQFDRFMLDYKSEMTLGKLFSSNNESMRVLIDIADKIGNLKCKTMGVHLRYRQHVQTGPSTSEIQNELLIKTKASFAKNYSEKIAELAADPIRKRKVLDLFDKITKIGDSRLNSIFDKYNRQGLEQVSNSNQANERCESACEPINYIPPENCSQDSVPLDINDVRMWY